MHRENGEDANFAQKCPSWLVDSNTWPSCWEATVLTTELLCPLMTLSLININLLLQSLDLLQVCIHVCLCEWDAGTADFREGPLADGKGLTHTVNQHTQSSKLTPTPLLIKQGADMLLLPSLTMWVFVWVLGVVGVYVCTNRWWRSAYLCVENWVD